MCSFIFIFSTAGTVWEGDTCFEYRLCGLIMVGGFLLVDKLAFLRGNQRSLSPASNLRVNAEFLVAEVMQVNCADCGCIS